MEECDGYCMARKRAACWCVLSISVNTEGHVGYQIACNTAWNARITSKYAYIFTECIGLVCWAERDVRGVSECMCLTF